MLGGEFKGGKGPVEFSDDLVGVFNLKGGVFHSPKKLMVKTDWIQDGGDFEHGKGTVTFGGTSHFIDLPKKEVFYNVVVDKDDRTILMLGEKDRIVISNKLSLNDGIINGGKFYAYGEVEHTSGFDGGSTELRVKGKRKQEESTSGTNEIAR